MPATSSGHDELQNLLAILTNAKVFVIDLEEMLPDSGNAGDLGSQLDGLRESLERCADVWDAPGVGLSSPEERLELAVRLQRVVGAAAELRQSRNVLTDDDYQKFLRDLTDPEDAS
jgi:hypothetical protein